MKERAKILVVDDDPFLRKTLADILGVKGYATVVAANGSEAVAAAEHVTFSLALIDLLLPDMSGLDVMARIKAISPLTEAIILTGHASMDSAIEATGQGAFSYLLKPYQMDELLLKIRQAVERQQAQEEILRLASFPTLNPYPVIELNPAGELTYANPAAEKYFPDLAETGPQHPLLHELAELIADLAQGKRQEVVTREVELEEATYELHISYVREVDLIRIYVLDITQRKRAEQEIHVLAITDSLTGVSNRREFIRVLTSELDRAKRYGAPMSLLMYDLDYFKRVNDNFGHDVGDTVLQAVTKLVQQHIRAADVVARWGGEEFVVLMPQTDIQAALHAAEKLRLAIGAYRFNRVNELTASLGVATLQPSDDLNSLLKRVDDALREAKKQGRNCVASLSGAADNMP